MRKVPSLFVGDVITSNEGSVWTVTEYVSSRDMTVVSSGGFVRKTTSSAVKAGKLKDPYFPSVLGVGYLGEGKYTSYNDKQAKKAWNGIMTRAYSPSAQYHYEGCTVHSDWHCFQDFAEWYYSNYIEGWQLDKDILVYGNKEYGPKTCCYVPQHINSLVLTSGAVRGACKQGVYFHGRKYVAHLSKINQIVLGRFTTEKEAFEVYAREKLLWAEEVFNMYDIKEEIKQGVREHLKHQLSSEEVSIVDA